MRSIFIYYLKRIFLENNKADALHVSNDGMWDVGAMFTSR